jgi:hypothetical protein
MNISKEIILKRSDQNPIWNINTIDGMSIRNMVMLKRFINHFNRYYLEPSDDELYECLPLLMNGTEVLSQLEIRKAFKRNMFCKMCVQISISPRIPLVKVIEFYNTNTK